MAKRTAALVVAWMILLTGTAGAQEAPLWPCEVTVSVEAGPWRRAALQAVRQLDAATAISWSVVEADAMVGVSWEDVEAPAAAFASVSATASAKVGGSVVVDPDVPGRWVMYTLLHELGHVAGIDHNDEVSVMGGGDVPFRRLTAWDLDALADLDCA